jgi:hypothetical protein
MDYHAKRALWLAVEWQQQDMVTKSFLLKPICMFLGQNKLTSDKGDQLRFWAHKQLARTRFYEARILTKGFDLVD